METISNITNAASKAIWGEGGGSSTNEASSHEPVAGEQGAGTTKEPFDKGNEENKSDIGENKSGEHTSGENTSIENKSDTVSKKEQDSHDKPSTTQNPDLGAKDTSGSASLENKEGKSVMPKNDAEREELVMKGEFPHDPNDHSGEPLKMHDGSEKKAEDTDDKDEKEHSRPPGDRSESVAHEGGAPHGSEKGTGQEVVKTSGVAADGGDFDATKPGAGQEATRLLEEKGIHKEKPADAANDSTSDVASKDSEKTKTSKMSKIKEKLHIGRNKS